MRPDSAPADVLSYTAANGGAMTFGAALLVGSAFPLVAFGRFGGLVVVLATAIWLPRTTT